MKSLQTFIFENEIENLNEGLLDKLKTWFKNLFKDQEELKNKTLDIDVNKIKGPKESVKLEDILKNSEEMKLLNDPKIGFPITAMLIKQKNKYLVQEDSDGNKKEYKPKIDRYFYVDNENGGKYAIAIIMYDDTIKNDNNYVNMISLETIDQINDKPKVTKYINDIFESKMKKKFKGSQYTGNHTAIKGILIRQQYKSENNNKDILFKNF